MTQYFKGDDTEIKFYEAGLPITEVAIASKDLFLEQGYEATPFLLILYDDNRIPFSDRINRLAFVDFIKEVYKRFPVVGTFDCYLFILRAIFGEFSTISFSVPAAGKLQIDVNATSSLEYDFIGEDDSGEFELIDDVDDILTFRGIAGIETEAELTLLFAEIMPLGIFPIISLSFFQYYYFVSEYDLGEIFSMVDNLDNQIIFVEVGI